MFSKFFSFNCFTLIFSFCVCITHATEIPQKCTTIFAHGLGGNCQQGEYYKNIVGGNITGKNGPEWDKKVYEANCGPEMSCLAQDADIAVITEQIESRLQENIILLGISKGAATMINTVGDLSSAKKSSFLKNVKAVILDSPFASPENVAMQYCGSLAGSSTDNSIGRSLLGAAVSAFFPKYDPKGITPIKAVTQMWDNVDKNIVIIFIHSQKDALISVDDSRLLYYELKKRGFTNLYLIEALDGEHGNVCWGPDRDSIIKKLCLIYAKHNLPFPKECSVKPIDAEQEQALVTEIQPSAETIYQKLYPLRALLTSCWR